MIRIASGQAFWGDWPQAPALQLRAGSIDYLILDYLAEVTVAILDKQRARDAHAGYARHFVEDIGTLLPEIVEKGVRVVTSAGGVNPRGCAEALIERARACGLRGLRVGIVEGDDVLAGVLGRGRSQIPLVPLGAGEPHFDDIALRVTSARAYLGARPIVEALRGGAAVVVTGRVTDTALALAPIVYELDLPEDDWDALALGTVVGHVLECGAQSTGGNYLADWRSVPDAEAIGFPIAEVEGRDAAVITKHDTLGGLVTLASVKEQLVYEIGDPQSYVTADCVADFTSIRLREDGPDRVRLEGVAGRPAPERLKVTCVYDAGFKVSGEITYCWPEAETKARAAGELLRKRAERFLDGAFEAWRIECVGDGACWGTLAPPVSDPPEIVLRVSARSASEQACERLGREIVGLVLSGPPGATGYAAGRPRPTPVRGIFSGLVPRSSVTPFVEVLES